MLTKLVGLRGTATWLDKEMGGVGGLYDNKKVGFWSERRKQQDEETSIARVTLEMRLGYNFVVMHCKTRHDTVEPR